MIIADPQFGVLKPKADPYLLEARQLDRAVDRANALQPAFVAIVGDMTNSRNNQLQRDTFFDRIGRLDKSIPLILVSGNHDHDNAVTADKSDDYRINYSHCCPR